MLLSSVFLSPFFSSLSFSSLRFLNTRTPSSCSAEWRGSVPLPSQGLNVTFLSLPKQLFPRAFITGNLLSLNTFMKTNTPPSSPCTPDPSPSPVSFITFFLIQVCLLPLHPLNINRTFIFLFYFRVCRSATLVCCSFSQGSFICFVFLVFFLSLCGHFFFLMSMKLYLCPFSSSCFCNYVSLAKSIYLTFCHRHLRIALLPCSCTFKLT